MSEQSLRQRVRREAVLQQAKFRRERAERDKRRQSLALNLAVALGERDAAERRAGAAVRALLEQGLGVAGIVEWSGGKLTTREVARLRLLDNRSQEAPAP